MDVLREEFELEAELIRGHGGIFEVAVDGAVVAKKTWQGFPTEEEIVASVAKVLEGR